MARVIDWSAYDRLKAQGVADREIARQWGIPWGTFHREKAKREGRAWREAQMEDISSTFRREKTKREAPPVPVQRPVQREDTGAVSRVATGAVQRLDQLEDEVQGLRQLVQAVLERLDRPPVQTPVQITTLPSYPKGKAVRWNLWILDAIRDELTTWAAEREMSPSQLVQEILWKALRERTSSPP